MFLYSTEKDPKGFFRFVIYLRQVKQKLPVVVGCEKPEKKLILNDIASLSKVKEKTSYHQLMLDIKQFLAVLNTPSSAK